MKKEGKQKIIDGVVHSFATCRAAFIVGCSSIPSGALQGVKKKIRLAGGRMTVVKNSLLKRSFAQDARLNTLLPFFKNQIAIIFSDTDDFQIVAGIVKGFGSDRMPFYQGVYGDVLFDSKKFDSIARLPSKKVVEAQLCGALQGIFARLVVVMQCIADKKKEL